MLKGAPESTRARQPSKSSQNNRAARRIALIVLGTVVHGGVKLAVAIIPVRSLHS